MKKTSRWYSDRIREQIQVVRWGFSGKPVLLFPTAGGDAEEVERFHLIGAVHSLIEGGRVKIYSCDSVAGRGLVSGQMSPRECGRIMNAFDACLYHEVVPAIRNDCGSQDLRIVAAGASIGAFNALAVLTRHPDAFAKAICLSGTYDLDRLLGIEPTEDFWYSSPLHFLQGLDDGDHLAALRGRFVLLAHGCGRAESPEQDWRIARLLGSKRIPNRVDEWGAEWPHDWGTWRAMLPKYLEELA